MAGCWIDDKEVTAVQYVLEWDLSYSWQWDNDNSQYRSSQDRYLVWRMGTNKLPECPLWQSLVYVDCEQEFAVQRNSRTTLLDLGKQVYCIYVCIAVNIHTLHWDTQCTAQGHTVHCTLTHSALHWDTQWVALKHTQCTALIHTVHYIGTHSALHWDTTCIALGHSVLHWDTQCLDCTVHCDPYIGLWWYLQINGKFERPGFK